MLGSNRARINVTYAEDSRAKNLVKRPLAFRLPADVVRFQGKTEEYRGYVRFKSTPRNQPHGWLYANSTDRHSPTGARDSAVRRINSQR